jgi:hypothetical protein
MLGLARTWTRLTLALVGLVVLVGSVDIARAATVLAMDLAALVHGSDQVVIALAEAETSHYRDHDRLIVTDVRLRVIDVLKGGAHAGDALIATRLGGTVDNLGLSVPGEASFPSGHSAIVFLRRVPALHELHVVGMSQGVLSIEGAGAGATVLPGGGGAALVQRGDDGKLRPAPDALLTPQPLRSVLTEIQKLVAAEPHAH